MKNGAKQVCPGDAIYEDINHDGVINEYDIYLATVTDSYHVVVLWFYN